MPLPWMVKSGLTLPESPSTEGGSHVGISMFRKERDNTRIRTHNAVIVAVDNPRDGDLNTAEENIKAILKDHWVDSVRDAMTLQEERSPCTRRLMDRCLMKKHSFPCKRQM